MGATRSRFSGAPGGWVIVDDHRMLAACREAGDDFLADRGIADQWIDRPLRDIDRVGVYLRKD